MPYGDSMSYLPAMSRLMGEVEQPTQNQGMTNPQFGGSPEQLMGMMQSPHIQEMLRQWGINFNPQQMRQSPFLPNAFMQGHPQAGGAISGALANVAATPEAPMVSGAGSGMTRAAQGMMGGPEMQRQFQVRQMLAPMQMIGQQMPQAEFQRKQQLLDLLSRMENRREQQGEEGLDIQRQRADQETMRGGPKFNQVTGETWLPQPAQQGHPTQAPQQQGGGTMPSEGFGIPPGIISPEQQYKPAGFRKESADPSRIAAVSQGKSAGAAGIAEKNIQGRKDVANIQGGYKKDVANIQSGSRENVANIQQGGKAQDRQRQTVDGINKRYQSSWDKLSQQYVAARHAGDQPTLDAVSQQMQELHRAWDQEIAAAKSTGQPGGQAGVVNPGAPQANAQPTGSGQARRPGGTGGPQAQVTAPAQQQDPTNPDFWRNAPPPPAPQQ
jgi:hypothetical protein